MLNQGIRKPLLKTNLASNSGSPSMFLNIFDAPSIYRGN